MKKRMSIVAGVLMTLFCGHAFAQFPEKNITMIVPYAAGGSTDITARALAVPLGKKLGVTVVIKNTTGGAGIIGAAELAQARPDGYTIGFMPPGPIVLQQYQRKLPYEPASFDYLGQATAYPVVLMSSRNVPWTDFPGMRAELEAHPGQYIFGSSGVGAIPHISAAALFKSLNLNVRHMPGTDAATNMAAMAGGTSHFYADMGGLAKQHNLLPLVVLAAQRSPDLPGVPTAAEVGSDLPPLEVWQGILAPAGLPAEIKAVLDQAVFEAVQDESFQTAAVRMEVQAQPRRSADFLVYSQQSMENFRQVMTSLGFTKK